MKLDFLIVGQGIAGSTLAIELLKRGKRVLVVDRNDEGSSSRVAAGLITPLTGKGMNPAWRQAQYLPIAEGFYRELERQSGHDFYHPTEVKRIFRNAGEREKWRDKQEIHARWGSEEVLENESIECEYGAIGMVDGAWLDTHGFLNVVRGRLESEGLLREENFLEQEVRFTPDGCQWKEVTAQKVILCQGAYGLGQGGWFGHLDHRSAKGEMLTLKIEGLDEELSYRADGWLAGRGDGTWKAGATYNWKDLDSETTNQAREEVLRRVSSWCRLPMEVVGHEAGVRPIIRNSRPVVGMHPEYTQLGFFNGLGSKGTLMAPAVAGHFADFLCGVSELDPELNMESSELSSLSYKTTKNLISTAHGVISQALREGDVAIDATVGNGHDTLFLASLVGALGKVVGFDVQKQAIDSTLGHLRDSGHEGENVTLYQKSHALITELISAELRGRVACVMFNLGYLPGADKALITQVKSTLAALQQSVEILKPGGVLSVMCYPGHEGGGQEAVEVKKWMLSLPSDDFLVEQYRREVSRANTPFLLVAHKKSS